MIIKSVYDDGIEYDTELKTINGSKVRQYLCTDDYNLYPYDTYHTKKLGEYHIVILTEDNNLYGQNGARWDGLYKYTVNVNREVKTC